jgi:hypothetical protein
MRAVNFTVLMAAKIIIGGALVKMLAMAIADNG